MNIDKLTYGQLKEIASLFGKTESSNLFSDSIGKYVIVRSGNEGINAGVVKQADETGVVLTDTRRIWYHKPKDKSVSWYEGVAKTGLSSESKVSCSVDEKLIIESYSITFCTKDAEKSIREMKSHEQS